MKCPKCGHRLSAKELSAEFGRRGGSVSSEAKRKAALKREAKKRKLKHLET